MRATTVWRSLTRISFLFVLILGLCFSDANAQILNSKKAKAYYYFLLSTLSNNYSKKQRYLLKAIRYDPNAIFLKKELVLFYLGEGKLSKAERILKELIKKAGSDTDIQLLYAKLLIYKNRFSQAEKILQKLIKRNPKNEELLRLLISVYLEKKDWNKALNYLNELIKLYPDNYVLWLFKARVLDAKKLYSEAKKAYLKALKLSDYKKSVLFEIITYLSKKRDFKGLEKIIKDVIEAHPDNINLVRFLISIYVEEKDWEGCIHFLKEYLKNNPSTEFKFFLGLCEEKLGNTTEALKIYRSLPEESKWFLQGCRRSVILLRKSHPEEAKKYFEKLRKFKIKDKSWYIFMSNTAEELDLCEEGVSIAKEGLKKYPDSLEIAISLASNYACLGDYQSVVKLLLPYLKKHKEDPYLLNFIGYSYVELGKKYKFAEKLLKKAIKLDPDDPYITDSLGWLYYKEGKLHLAYKYIKKAVKNLEEKEAVIYEHFGLVLIKLGKVKEGCKYLKEALKACIHKSDSQRIEEELKLRCQGL